MGLKLPNDLAVQSPCGPCPFFVICLKAHWYQARCQRFGDLPETAGTAAIPFKPLAGASALAAVMPRGIRPAPR